MKILTQEQAHKRYPKRGYDKYSPMLLLVGTRQEFMRGKALTAEYHVHGEAAFTLPVRFDPDNCAEPDGMMIDVSGRKPFSICRVVVWR